MTAFWTEADFDDHELVEVVRDAKSGLTAIIALHSTHLGPGAGGTRFWHYAEPADAMRDALRLSRGMSYKNAMAGLPMGGGKAVILAKKDTAKTPEMLAAFADAVERLNVLCCRPADPQADPCVLRRTGRGARNRLRVAGRWGRLCDRHDSRRAL